MYALVRWLQERYGRAREPACALSLKPTIIGEDRRTFIRYIQSVPDVPSKVE